VVSKNDGDKPNLTIKENSPTSGLLRFLVARGGIDQSRGLANHIFKNAQKVCNTAYTFFKSHKRYLK